jgi:chromosome segregation ATPase
VVTVMAEGSETPGEPPRPSERDLLAERRARRAVDLEPPTPSRPEDVLTRRAEAAEATVQALEAHLSSLQQRVREAAEERAVFAERLAAEQTSVAEREHELRRVKQREYAEQQLRVEAEDRRMRSERDGSAEIDRLTRRLGASEHHARELAERLESAQRELDEAEQAAAAELAQLRSAVATAELRSSGERELRLRLAELERRALEIGHELDAERSARARAEHQLHEMRAGYRRMELIVAELKSGMAQLRAATAHESLTQRPAPAVRGEQREELADALAAAVERLRARAEASVESGEPVDGDGLPTSASPELARSPVAPSGGSSSELARPPAVPGETGTPHRHTMSLLTRARLKRKQRRERRLAKTEPPRIQSQ